MMKKSCFVILLLVMLISALPLFSEEIPFREGIEGNFGFDEPDLSKTYPSYTTGYAENHWIPFLPWEKYAGASHDTVIELLQETGLVYTASCYEPDIKNLKPSTDTSFTISRTTPVQEGFIIYGFLKADPRYYLKIIYNMDGSLYETGYSYYETNDLFLEKCSPLTMEDVRRDQWNSMSELEQYACAFSSNLTSANGHSLYTFKLYDNNTNMTESLASNWGIHNYDELIKETDKLMTSGHHGYYNRLRKMLEENPEMSVKEIARAYMLKAEDTSCLYFVRDMNDILGEHGVEAWDYGRAIYNLRCGAESGMISQEEALARSAPFVELIRKSYSSWEDYMAHYLAGRGFWSVSYGDVLEKQVSGVGFCDKIMDEGIIPNIYMEGAETNTNPVMTLNDCYYTCSEEAQTWEDCLSFFLQDEFEKSDVFKAETYISQFPENPLVRLLQLQMYFKLNLYSISLPLYSDLAYLFPSESADGTSNRNTNIYQAFYLYWLVLANSYGRYGEAISAADMLLPEYPDSGFVNCQKAVACLNLMMAEKSAIRKAEYEQIASDCVMDALDTGYDVYPELLDYFKLDGI